MAFAWCNYCRPALCVGGHRGPPPLNGCQGKEAGSERRANVAPVVCVCVCVCAFLPQGAFGPRWFESMASVLHPSPRRGGGVIIIHIQLLHSPAICWSFSRPCVVSDFTYLVVDMSVFPQSFNSSSFRYAFILKGLWHWKLRVRSPILSYHILLRSGPEIYYVAKHRMSNGVYAPLWQVSESN